MRANAKAAAAATRAYVTFLAGDSLKGVVGLAMALRKLGSAYPLVVAVLPDVPESHRRVLVSHGCVVREVEPVHPPENQAQLAMADYVANYSKLRIWEFVEYERMVYVDAGIQVLDNIDDLFELEKGHLYATRAWFPFPELRRPPPAPYFNTDMFVHEPSMATAKALLDALYLKPPSNPTEVQQDLLNVFFRDQYKPIPLDDKLVLAMPTLRHRPDQNLQPFRNWLKTAMQKEKFSRKNLPAVATLAASSAAVGVVASVSSPAICFTFYAVFIAAIALVTISLRGI